MPEAAVIHSHEYSAGQWMRRSFDEARALAEVYGWVAALPVWSVTQSARQVVADWRWVTAAGARSPA